MLRTRLVGLVSAAVLAAACGTSLARPPVGTEFTYQGQLLKNGQALTGPADFRFTLFDGPGPTANAVGSPQNVPNIPVNAGRFECTINFGDSPYTTNEERWLQVEVRNPAGIPGPFSLMGERQKLTASPFSLATRGITVAANGEVLTASNLKIPANTGIFTHGGATNNGGRLHIQSGNDGTFDGLYLNPFPNGGNVYLGNGAGAANLICYDRVGIGVGAPGFPLEVSGRVKVRAGASGSGGVWYTDDDAPATEKSYFGRGSAADRFTGVFSIQTGSWPMVVKDSGNVGIGTTTPTRGKLDINGTGGSTSIPGPWGYLGTGGAGNASGTGALSISLYASNDVHASVFRAFSDVRIKDIVGRSDGVKDLDTLLNVEITDYTFKDTIGKGTEPQKKVIGQQVEEVYPLAVRKTNDIIPDIYKKAPVQGGWVMLGTDLKVGDKVRVIGKDAQTESTVAEVKDGAFRVADLPAGDEVFVYGREVSDFRTVDYEAIAMLNVSATQELARQNMAQQKRIEELESERASVSARLAKLEAALADKSTATASK